MGAFQLPHPTARRTGQLKTGRTLPDAALVLEGLRKIVYGEHSGSDGYRFMRIQQWFTEPTEARKSLRLSPADHSLICQYALYGKTVFPTGEKEELFGKKFDLFEDQRATPSEGQPPTDQL